MSSLYSVGAMNQLADALEVAGFTPEDVTRLKQFCNLKGIKDILFGRAEIKPIEHLIDCDADPYVPEGSEVIEHKKGGQLKWDPARISLYLSKKQKDGKVIEGDKLRDELENMPVLNANVLDFLLANQHLIPEEWKSRAIFFWGTIYRDLNGRGAFVCVRCLDWYSNRWHGRGCNLAFDWDSCGPAAMLKS